VIGFIVGCLLEVVAFVGGILGDVFILMYNFMCRYLPRSSLRWCQLFYIFGLYLIANKRVKKVFLCVGLMAICNSWYVILALFCTYVLVIYPLVGWVLTFVALRKRNVTYILKKQRIRCQSSSPS
jgi:hypothetical protein